MSTTRLVGTATCSACEWTATGDQDEVDHAAEKHCAGTHCTQTVLVADTNRKARR